MTIKRTDSIKYTRGALILVTLMIFSVAAYSEDTIELDEISIRGARELPKVLYIVPWKKLEPNDKPIKLQSMVDEIMTPVDREVLRRQVLYYDKRNKNKAGGKSAKVKGER